MARLRMDSEVGDLPQVSDFVNLKDDPARAEKTFALLNSLLGNLESGVERLAAIKVLHALADSLEKEGLNHLSLRSIEVPGLDKPVKLILTPAVFSPELWGKTFAEGLMKNPEQFDSKRVVELGCGCGWISLLLLKKTNVKEVVGLDINPVAVTIARLNAWLNGTEPNGAVLTSKAGVPLVGAFRIAQSDLLADPINSSDEFDHIIGCIPQVLHPEKEVEDIHDTSLVERDLYDLSNYCFEQGILEDRFGLPLIARALEESQLCLKRGGKVTLILGGRPGPGAIKSMFERRGFKSQIVWSRRIPQADDTDLASLVSLEKAHGIRFHFFMSGNSSQSISAETAVALIKAGEEVFHDLIVYQATTRFEAPTFSFVKNLSKLSLGSLRKELDFSRMTEEQMSFLERLSSDFIRRKTVPYPHERSDISLRSRLGKFLRIYCQIPMENNSIFVAPERCQLLSMIANMVCQPAASVLVSESLREVYLQLPKVVDVKTIWCNDDLSEILDLDEVVKPSVVVLSPVQFDNPSPILLNALFEHARKNPQRWYIIDDSSHFNIGSQLDSNAMLRMIGQMEVPPNVVLLYGLVKNIVCPDLELSFLVNAPSSWIEGFDVAAELTYSRIPYPSQLYYQWLFDDLLSFPFPNDVVEETKVKEDVSLKSSFRKEFELAASDHTFKPKPISTDDDEVIRLDYGEFEYPVPDLLVKGLIKGFVETRSEALVETLKIRTSSYIARTRDSLVVPDRIAIAQGAFPIFGALVRALGEKLGRKPLVAVPDGSYGPLYPMLVYHGAEVIGISTSYENGFSVTGEMLEKLNPKPDLLWLTQPSNPSGVLLDSSAVTSILEVLKKRDIYLLADELFFLLSDFRLGESTPPYLSFGNKLDCPKNMDNIFVVDGTSKAFAAGGLRCGFIVCPDNQWAQTIQSYLFTPPAAILRAWDNLYTAFLDEAPHGMIDINEARGELSSYLREARRTLTAHFDQIKSLLDRYELSDGLDTPYRGGLFVVAKMAHMREELARKKKLLINSADWSRTGEWSRIS